MKKIDLEKIVSFDSQEEEGQSLRKEEMLTLTGGYSVIGSDCTESGPSTYDCQDVTYD